MFSYVTNKYWAGRLLSYMFLGIVLWNIFAYITVYKDDRDLREARSDSNERMKTMPEDGGPSIGSTPEADDAANNNFSPTHDEEVSLKYCGSRKCKFLFVYDQPEQESKAQQHFRTLTRLAQGLGRVMVMPNVGASLMGSCQKNSFDFYYEVTSLRKVFPGVRFILQDDFKKWTQELNRTPTVHHVVLDRNIRVRSGAHKIVPLKETIQEIQRKACLQGSRLSLEKSTRIILAHGWRNDQRKCQIAASFITDATQSNADVVLLQNLSIWPMFPDTQKPLDYSDRLLTKVLDFGNRLRPYVAIHWRMETARPVFMPKCAEGLIEFLKNLERDKGVKHVYLATDYPLGGHTSQSGSWRMIDENHHRAMRILNGTIPFDSWVSFHKAAETEKENSSEFMNAGVHGILDKLMCTHADYFVRPPERCRKQFSTWTNMVTEARDKLMSDGDENIKNVFAEWT